MLGPRVYEHSPHWLRDVLVSLQGQLFVLQRYGKIYANARQECQQLEYEARHNAAQRQDRLFSALVQHAASRSPVYQELYRGVALPQRVCDIATLPVLTKESVRAALDGLRTRPHRAGDVSVHTSGMTGTPLEFSFDRADFQRRMAVLDSYRAWFGVERGDRRATFSGRVVTPARDRSGRFWQTNRALNQRLYSSYHLSAENLPSYIDDLERFRPRFLDGYPSTLWILARHLLSQGRSLSFKPRVIFVTGENLSERARDDLQAAFDCAVKDQYASSEGAPFIVECEAGRHHFLSYTGVLEILDEAGAPAESGRAVFTSFHSNLMPLIRYDIGDFASWSRETSCDCGRHYPLVERISGREEDYLVSSTRGKVGRLDPIFKKLPPSILRSQIVQRAVDEIELLYVPDRARFQQQHLDVIAQELRDRLGEQLRIQFHSVDEIPMRGQRKFKAVVSELDDVSAH